jgi:hypothetical protein
MIFHVVLTRNPLNITKNLKLHDDDDDDVMHPTYEMHIKILQDETPSIIKQRAQKHGTLLSVVSLLQPFQIRKIICKYIQSTLSYLRLSTH